MASSAALSLLTAAASLMMVALIGRYPGRRAPRAWGWTAVLLVALTLAFGVAALTGPARAHARRGSIPTHYWSPASPSSAPGVH